MNLTYHPSAEAELVFAIKLFTELDLSLGRRFYQEAEHCLEIIKNFPEQNRILDSDIRLMTMPRFPYVIYHHYGFPKIQILSFKNQPLHPDHWRYQRASVSGRA
jgi:toxin ParE1/3/4